MLNESKRGSLYLSILQNQCKALLCAFNVAMCALLLLDSRLGDAAAHDAARPVLL